jgi:hypothetical protein
MWSRQAADRIEQLEAELTRANAATAAAYEVAACKAELWDNAYKIRALATPDQTAALDKLIAEAVEPLLIAAKSGLRFIENTESELGIILGCGDSLRNAILAASKKGGV